MYATFITTGLYQILSNSLKNKINEALKTNVKKGYSVDSKPDIRFTDTTATF